MLLHYLVKYVDILLNVANDRFYSILLYFWMIAGSMGESGWMFILVPAHLGSPGQRAIKWLRVCLCVCVCVCVRETAWQKTAATL